MTDDRLPLAELMAKSGDGDFLRTVAESVLQIIMEADVDGLIGAGRHERSGDPKTSRTATALVKDDKHPGYGRQGKAACSTRLPFF